MSSSTNQKSPNDHPFDEEEIRNLDAFFQVLKNWDIDLTQEERHANQLLHEQTAEEQVTNFPLDS